VDSVCLEGRLKTARQLIQRGFIRRDFLAELVRALEGVPRDAINLLSLLALRVLGRRIAMDHIRTAQALLPAQPLSFWLLTIRVMPVDYVELCASE
jgi:hypothetical protein